ncbi:MAG: CocE/NonD family hydrolase [Dehalococcoidales bacterium]|nr:CocE/NonD family hydrolase [Dehalococcoidales bacterium]
MTSEISYEKIQFGRESIEVAFRKAQPLDTKNRGIELQTSSKIEFKPGTTVLKTGTTFIEGGVALPCNIVWHRDVGVKMRDGTTIYADIFLPAGNEKVPAILSWSPYGKTVPQPAPPGVDPGAVSGLQKFEGPDPAYWCNHGYAIINVDARGSFYSEGDIYMWGTQSAEDCFDFIEWTAVQEWCTGKVAMSGNSWLGIIQWFAAVQNPPHLAAIAPWEGHIDLYRYDVLRGGIRDTAFNDFNISTQIGLNRIEDMAAMAEKYPLMNAYWKDKVPELEKISVPSYIVASWGGHQTIDAFRRISSREKWLRVHNTGEWPDYYEYTENLRRFFDHFLKGINNDWEKTPGVRLSILDPGGTDQVNRPEKEWPLSRTQYEKYYLDASMSSLSLSPVANEKAAHYKADDNQSELAFTLEFNEDTEFAGYVSLHLWIETDVADDADIFVLIQKLDADDKPVPGGYGFIGPDGRLRASHRKLDTSQSTPWFPYHPHDAEELLTPGQPVPLDIEIRPIGMRWHKGEKLQLTIAGNNVLGRFRQGPPGGTNLPGPATRNKGNHIIHTGGSYDSYLLLPRIV